MKYQIYLQKDVSDIINKIAKFENIKPSTLIKNLLEDNFRTAYKQATEPMGATKNGKAKQRKI